MQDLLQGSVPGWGRAPGGRNGQKKKKDERKKRQLLTPVFLPRESRGQESQVGYSPWGHKESDMTEQLSTHVHIAS